MTEHLLPIVAFVLLLTLLIFEVHQRLIPRVIVKTLLSSLFVITALMTPYSETPFGRVLLLGLILCFVGDVFLALEGPKMFLIGLVAFLLGHLAYVTAFITIAEVSWLTTPAFALHAVIAAGVLRWLRPHLGRMINPVLAYLVVITAMVIAAWSIFGTASLNQELRQTILIGALLFYLSDLFVARHRFVKKQPLNRFLGLPAYYAGQFLLASSIGLLAL
jgi:uncharacterized membrane protein YhhN